uniref:Replication-associated protein n=1 Tax=Red panda feces-associated genomovirus TaxID=2863991 RepID=A0A8K1HIP9_9VIRU|nr:replication-associated protein [Red panda feces-associated genomovirus]
METPPSSGSAPNAFSSHTPRLVCIGIIMDLHNLLVDLAQEESFAENCTKMAEFITTLSSYSTERTRLAMSLTLMLETLTPISNQYDSLLERHTTIAERTGMLSGPTSVTRILMGQDDLVQLCGQTSLLNQTRNLFLTRSRAWIRELLCVLSPASRNTQTGPTARNQHHTIRQWNLLTPLSEMNSSALNSRNGTMRQSEDDEQEGLFNLDQFDNTAEYAVFDDLAGGMEFFHSYKQWMGGQMEFTVTDKYRHKKHIKFGKFTVYCSNTDPREDKGVDVEWLEGNCIFVHVNSKVFNI